MKIGIDVGGSHIGVGIIDSNFQLIAKKQEDYSKYENDMSLIIIQMIIRLINETLKENELQNNKIELIGIAFPGTVSNGTVIKSENLGIRNFNIETELKKEFDIPIYLNNDAKCAGVLEKKLGSLKEYEDALFLIIGTGVGGAVFFKNELLKPKRYSGFEVGHMVIDKNGLPCNCGRRGCFEAYASMKRLREKIQKEFNLLHSDGRTIEDFINANLNDKKLNNIIDEYIDNLTIGIANLINIFEPQAISIGGSFVYYASIILDKLKQKLLTGNELFNKGEIPKILTAKFKNDAGIIGATMIQ